MLAACKWVLSFRKREWSFEDYPVRIAEQEPGRSGSTPRFHQHRYLAYLVYSAVTGWGDSRKEALTSLAGNFESVTQRRKEEGLPAIRPGETWPIEFASQEKISMNETLCDEFVQKVLGLEWAFISDESSLWDFHHELTNERLLAKIRDVYGVDVSDIESARLWEILERIRQTRG